MERHALGRHAPDEGDEDPADRDAEAEAEHQAGLSSRPEGEIHDRPEQRRGSREQEQLLLELELAGQVDRGEEPEGGRQTAHAQRVEDERRGDPGEKRPEPPLDPGISEKVFHSYARAARITPFSCRTCASARFNCAMLATSKLKRMKASSSRLCVRTAVTLIFSRASASPISRSRPRRSVAVTAISMA